MLWAIYPKAVESGIPAAEFWDLTFEEVMVQTEANVQHEKEQLTARAYMDHQLASLIAYAFNDPAKMPRVEEAYPFVNDGQEKEEIPEWKKDQLILMQQAEMIKRSRNNQ